MLFNRSGDPCSTSDKDPHSNQAAPTSPTRQSRHCRGCARVTGNAVDKEDSRVRGRMNLGNNGVNAERGERKNEGSK